MNKTLVLGITALLTLACNTAPSEVAAQTKEAAQTNVKSYGATITPDGAIGTAEFVKAMADKESLTTKLDCEIITSCVKKGCWMSVKLPDGEQMRVSFKDYGFFVPTQGLEGKRAVIEGVATKETTDVAALRHYAEDAGKSKEEIEKITEPKHELTFLADGVLITY
jgi:hypothetical protein